MRYLAIRLWGSMPNKPRLMPDAWPAHVVDLGQSRTLPPGPYILMEHGAYVAYVAKNKSTYDNYERMTAPEPTPPEE